MPSVYDYLDFKAYLGAYYEAQKALGRGFSYRAFSRRVGLKAPNHLQQVILGAKRLTDEMIDRYARALKLSAAEAAYFADLVRFNQSESSQERDETYRKLTKHRGYRSAQRVDRKHAAYYSRWYVPAIRELAFLPEFQLNAEWVAARVVPRITDKQAADALEILLSLGLLIARDDGSAIASEEIVVAEDATRGVHLATYHAAMLNRARESIHAFSSEHRNLSALTLAMDRAAYERVVERVREFRQELVALVGNPKHDAQVMQLGIQLFPLTMPSQLAQTADKTRRSKK